MAMVNEKQAMQRRDLAPSHVCRHWRSTAISDPKLWIHINLELLGGREDSDTHLTELWLSRSGDLPITIELSIRHELIFHHPCLPMLISQSRRWKRADIQLPFDMLRPLQGILYEFPLLEELSVDTTSMEFANGWEVACLDMFQCTPQLHKLTFFDDSAGRWKLVVPYHQLIAFDVHEDGSADRCLDWLQTCPNLRRWNGEFWNFDYGSAISSRQVVVHSNLQSWSMFCNGESASFNQLMERLSLPALKSFAYNSGDETTDCDLTLLTSLLSRSSASLTSLSLWSGCEPSSQEIIQCLEACPMLQVLNLRDSSASGVDFTLLRRLTHRVDGYGTTGCCLVPKLRNFSVDVSKCFNYKQFGEMVKSRWRHFHHHCRAPDHQEINRIREVQLCRTFYEKAEDEPAGEGEEPPYFDMLYEFRAEGLKVHAVDYSCNRVALEQYPLRRAFS